MPAHGLRPRSRRLGAREKSGRTESGRREAGGLIGTRLRKRVRDGTVRCSGGTSARRRCSCLANDRQRAAACLGGSRRECGTIWATGGRGSCSTAAFRPPTCGPPLAAPLHVAAFPVSSIRCAGLTWVVASRRRIEASEGALRSKGSQVMTAAQGQAVLQAVARQLERAPMGAGDERHARHVVRDVTHAFQV